ncbi:hypothetical protein RCL_jg22500.t1 [Rhizophagus clarus]|uniref:Uncharacterized protein n=1 Tax=Rhizophagus clarus TaxID=94130 RepID=A0A8H3MA94_9GLOM|nr:hypothetical protein RCL_jg22500.t1 [Rhizophagus clarus]
METHWKVPNSIRNEGLAKIYRFNLSDAAEQLYQTEMTSEMMKNVAKTVFNEFEKVASLEESENAELSNQTERLYTNDNEEDDESSENEDYEYNVNEIVTRTSL